MYWSTDLLLALVFSYVEASSRFLPGGKHALLNILNVLSGLLILPSVLYFLFLLFTSPKEIFGRKPTDVRRLTELGSGHIPEDRQKDGLVLPLLDCR